ncbi:DNA repair protein RAD51 homolog 4 [Toxorhynchites rutilus septentrionalis]|uniref:DNA repair protein RAD51 homolog 4 n=1 Tax=Toxorhynchites rutilus septentrionalis TaxID=329112 RepID=UPI00247914EB|nr:DNA repair protein RAD51 homolog 4 [Toxorhynchites rutilus septentrionalis]
MATVSLSADTHPDITMYVIKLLTKNNIVTILDFAQADIDRLVRITKLSPEAIRAIKSDIINRYCGNVINVIEYFRYLDGLVEPIPTSINGLDALLEGGLLLGHTLEICGESGTGKTRLCVSLAANVAQYSKFDSIYVDTKCDFSATELRRMLQQRKSSDQETKEIMQRIKIHHCFSLADLVDFVEELLAIVDDMKAFKVLIIDSLPSLWYMHQNSKSSCYSLGLLTRLAGSLRKLASENLISVVIVNLAIRPTGISAENNGRKVVNQRDSYSALGRFWESVPTTRLLTSKIEENKIVISIWKSNYLKKIGQQITITNNY